MRLRHLLIATGATSLVLGLLGGTGAPSGASLRAATPNLQLGFNTYVTYNCESPSLFASFARRQFAQFEALGANTVAIAFPLYTSSIYSNSVFGKDRCNDQAYQTPPVGIVGDLVDVAHELGLKVLLRPLIDQVNLYAQNPNWWRGVLQPTNLGKWFASYLATLRPYLAMAQADHVEHVAVETELDSLLPLSNWTNEIRLVHAVYTGDLEWDYSWNWKLPKVTRRGTTFAIDAYPPLKGTTPATSVTTLTSKWTALLNAPNFKVPDIASTTIDEVGIAAQDGAYAFPYRTSLPLGTYPLNPAIQANWFSAACLFMRVHRMQGVYFWGAWLALREGALLATPGSTDPEDLQPQAQAAIRRCFESTATTASAPSITGVAPSATSLSIAFLPPASDGGLPVTSYEVSTDGGATWATPRPSTTSSPLVVGGLTPATTYEVRLRAVTALGPGSSSGTWDAKTSLATPATAPRITSVLPATGGFELGFDAPSSTGGAPVTTYQVSVDAGATWATRSAGTTASPLAVGGLQPDALYRLELRAVTTAGPGAASKEWTAKTAAPATAPTILRAAPSTDAFSIEFSPPHSTGGSAVTTFDVSIDGGATWHVRASGTIASPLTVGGLAPHTTYQLELRAETAWGAGAPSKPWTATTLTGAGPPAITKVTAATHGFRIFFTAPTSTGGSPITTYQVSVDGGATWAVRSTGTTGSPLVVTGLAPHTTYELEIRAVTAAGPGAATKPWREKTT